MEMRDIMEEPIFGVAFGSPARDLVEEPIFSSSSAPVGPISVVEFDRDPASPTTHADNFIRRSPPTQHRDRRKRLCPANNIYKK